MTEPERSDNSPSVAARNPADVQVDILLEAYRSIMLRLTSIENALCDLTDVIGAHEQATQKSLRVLQAEIDELRQVVFGVPAPRRCLRCTRIVSALTFECEVCKKTL